MGNILTLLENEKESRASFGQILDYIATYYILTLDFQSLKKLNEKDYCDNLIILTSDILDRYFNNNEISYLAQRTRAGLEVNEMTKDSMLYFNKDDLDKTNMTNTIKKKRVCIGIAKFYIKIAHIFAAIVTTINPVYIYKDVDGSTIKKKLFEKDQIPPNVERKLYKMGICDNRISALKHGQKLDTDEVQNIHPKVCDINVGSDGDTKNLGDEPGVPELMDLYLDKYDYSSGDFIGMTDETQRQYNNDLARFYRVFTGNEVMPPTIQKFSDIKLKDFNKLEGCSGPDAALRKQVTLNKMEKEDALKKKLFEDYAENLKQMVHSVNKNQEDLLEIINDLFTYVIDPQTGRKRIIVQPRLSETKLQDVVVKTRKIIVNLYLKCETDYALGVKIYQAIVEKQIKDTTLNQINTLEQETDKLINLEPKVPIIGEVFQPTAAVAAAGISEQMEEPEDYDEDNMPEDFEPSPENMEFQESPENMDYPEQTPPMSEDMDYPEQTPPMSEDMDYPEQSPPMSEGMEYPEQTPPTSEGMEYPEQTPPMSEDMDYPEQSPPMSEGMEYPEQSPPTSEGMDYPEQTPPTSEGMDYPEQSPPTSEGMEYPEQSPPTSEGMDYPEQSPPTSERMDYPEQEQLEFPKTERKEPNIIPQPLPQQ
jgi:hypothetical protein